LIDDIPGTLIDTFPSDFSPNALISQSFQSFQKGNIPTFMDSGASDTMFVSRDVFVEYNVVTSRTGESAKANNGGFEIAGEGNAVQRYNIDGREQEITYTRALHAPTLNANLISVSAFDNAGLFTTFGNGRGITRKADGTVVLAGKNVNGMYILETLDTPQSTYTPLAMNSLSRPVSLEQWHRRLAHCSPSTIKDMANGNLVEGLIISEETLAGGAVYPDSV
jgi:hypothetical protein